MSSRQRQKTFNTKVYQHTLVTLKGEEHLVQYRAPSRAEVMSARSISMGSPYSFYEELIITCVISPEIIFEDREVISSELRSDDFKAGEILVLGVEIEKSLGLNSPDIQQRLAAEADEYITSEAGRLDLLALAVLPSLSPIDLLEASPDSLFRIWKQAEALASANGIDSRIFLDPESYMKDVKLQEQKAMLEAKQIEAEEFESSARNRRQRKMSRQSSSITL